MFRKYSVTFSTATWSIRALVLGLTIITIFQTDCKPLVEVPPSITSVNSANVYSSDATAVAVLTGIYTNMSLGNAGFYGLGSLFLYPSLSADELTLYDINNSAYLPYYSNRLTNSSTIFGTDYWLTIYPVIYITNSAIQGLTNNSAITPAVSQQLIGEAKFMRAFCYFYLVNLYGDVPLVTGTDYTVNAQMPRTSQALVWQQIITDLKDAQASLNQNFLDATVLNTTTQRVRPTLWVATALLARSYLYTGDFANAEAQASSIIAKASMFSLDSLNGVFLANSQEAIWQLQPVGAGVNSNTGEGAIFNLPPTGPNTSGAYPVYLSNFLINAFEPNDQRRVNWVDSVTVGNTIYYYAYKYKIGLVNAQTSEYSTIFRLGEQYLIRAEAEAQLNDLVDAANDLNAIRNRAGLANTPANDQASLLNAISHERQVELFTEWGHRWLDLKRTGNINTVMGSPGGVCAAKGGQWTTNWQWYPIPLSELQADPKLQQNSGY
jgi:starch-binding outer membrane protein, SusD/RagB family